MTYALAIIVGQNRYESVRSDFSIAGDNNAFGRDRAESSQFGMSVPPPKIR